MHLNNQRMIYINLLGIVKHIDPLHFHILQELVTCYYHSLNNLLKFQYLLWRMGKLPIKGLQKYLQSIHQLQLWQNYAYQIGVLSTIVNTQQKICNFLLHLTSNTTSMTLKHTSLVQAHIYEFLYKIIKLQTPVIK